MPSKRNKILLVLYYYHPYVSGVSICAKRVAEGLVKNGYEVTVLTSRFDKSLPKEETIKGVRVVRRPVLFTLGKGVIMPTFWLDMIRYARHHDYVNPHLPMSESGLASLFIPRRKIVTTYQCDIFLGKGLVSRLITSVSMALMRLQLSRSRVVIPSSMDYLENSKMRRYLPKARAIGPTVTVHEFYPVDSKPLYKRLGVKTAEKRIGFVGRVVYEKGINYLLEAVPNLKKELKDFKILIAGDYEKVAGGSIKEELDAYLAEYPDNIIFTGYLSDDDLKRFYSGLDIFVLPSIDPLEAYGMVQIEAMLCGAPVVASNLPGVRQIVKQTGYGRISQIKDSKDIAKQIVEVLRHHKQYKPTREKVALQFDPQASFEAYAELMPKD